MQVLFEILLILVALFFMWRVFRLFGGFKKTPEPPEPAGVLQRVGKGPKGKSGAVALEEPDEE